MAGILCYNSHLTPICLLYTVRIAQAVLPYVFKMALPASPFPAKLLHRELAPHALDSQHLSMSAEVSGSSAKGKRLRVVNWKQITCINYPNLEQQGGAVDQATQRGCFYPSILSSTLMDTIAILHT